MRSPSSSDAAVSTDKACWTCKLRRKRCDEQHPCCGTCMALEIPCHGYGERPAWKDGGDKEAELTHRIKRMVKTNLQRRRRELSRRSRQPAECSMQSAMTGAQFFSSRTASPQGSSASSLALETSASLDIGEMETTTSTSFVPMHGACAQQIPNTKRTLGIDYAALATLPSENLSSPTSSIEPILLGYYFDTVFDQCFPFYKLSSPTQSRTWLLSLISDQNPAYYSTLALAATYQSIVCPNDAIPNYTRKSALSDAQQYHTTALRALRDQLDLFVTGKRLASADPDGCARVLLSILQLVFASILRSENQAWKLHFEAACRLLAVNPVGPRQRPHATSGSHTNSTYASLQGVNASMDFLMGSCVRLDALSCATLRHRPNGSIKSSSILSSHDVSSLSGCPNAAIDALLRISDLDKWRQEEESFGRLSLPRLVQRAHAVEGVLRGLLQDYTLDSQRTDSVIGASVDSVSNSTPKDQIAPVYIAAALVYLHVVVSGPFPHLPEIKASVRGTMERLRVLPPSARARLVAWPLCVAGCMATEEDMLAFVERGDLYVDTALRPSPSTQLAFQIMAKCWRLRATTGGCHDWKSTMDVMGCQLPLI
ncbi:hypothetical protein ANO11243_079850 [Dothideomycetidae sp. 11243]|nr:hypothetical protein ANO11243_079850 [fungal sp. No.11243]